LDALFDGAVLSSRQAVLFVDLTVMWGHAYKAAGGPLTPPQGIQVVIFNTYVFSGLVRPGALLIRQAFVSRQQLSKTPCFYLGFHLDQVHFEWHSTTMVSDLARRFKDGRLAVPGFQVQEPTPPANHMEAAPVRPQLKKLEWVEVDGAMPTLVVHTG